MELLGYLLRDKVTGFTGVATAFATSPHNVDRYALMPLSVDNKMGDAYDIDAALLEKVEETRRMEPVPLAPVDINYGDEVEDSQTGFRGKAGTKVQHITGCTTFIVNPPPDKEGKYQDGLNFASTRLKVIKPVAIQAPQATRGGPATRSVSQTR